MPILARVAPRDAGLCCGRGSDRSQMPRSEKTFSPRKRRLSPNARRALTLLATSPHGANEALLVLVHGFKRQILAGLVRAGLATAEREIANAGGKPVEVVRVRITNDGRKAIKE